MPITFLPAFWFWLKLWLIAVITICHVCVEIWLFVVEMTWLFTKVISPSFYVMSYPVKDPTVFCNPIPDKETKLFEESKTCNNNSGSWLVFAWL